MVALQINVDFLFTHNSAQNQLLSAIVEYLEANSVIITRLCNLHIASLCSPAGVQRELHVDAEGCEVR